MLLAACFLRLSRIFQVRGLFILEVSILYHVQTDQNEPSSVSRGCEQLPVVKTVTLFGR